MAVLLSLQQNNHYTSFCLPTKKNTAQHPRKRPGITEIFQLRMTIKSQALIAFVR